MIKYFCDRCGKECDKEAMTIQRFVYDGLGAKIDWIRNDHLCSECMGKFLAIRDKLKYEDDIFDMTDEDVELLRYTFKVGDEVITDDGRVGIIESVCTCDKCKERGFYEPRVKMKIGSQIYITDTDKSDGFRGYYKIGDQVFGNINDGYLWQHREAYMKAIEEIDAQLDVIKKLKENNNGN